MRAMVLAIGVMAAATAAAQTPAPSGNDGTRLHLPQSDVVFFRGLDSGGPGTGDTSIEPAHPARYTPLSQPVLTVGAFNLRLGNEGTGAHFAHYDFGDTRFFGGNLTGTLDGSKGNIRLSWPLSTR